MLLVELVSRLNGNNIYSARYIFKLIQTDCETLNRSAKIEFPVNIQSIRHVLDTAETFTLFKISVLFQNARSEEVVYFICLPKHVYVLFSEII